MKKIQFFTVTVFSLLLWSFVPTAHSAVVKMTNSNICHPEESPYYKRIKNYTSYPTLDACLNAGGHLPKNFKASAPQSQKQQQSQKINTDNYKRSHFGIGWEDLDHDGQDSRQEALIAQSTAPVRFKDNKRLRVSSGRWISPYSNAVIHDPSKMDIDHVVPLKWAWEHGANNWTQQQREQFANDPSNLLSVEASLNRQKGAKGPDEWLPPANKCEYVLRFMRIVKKYKLHESTSLQNTRLKVCR